MAERKKRKKKDNYSQHRQGGNNSSSDHRQNNQMMDAFRQQAYSEYEAAYQELTQKRINITDTVYQLKVQEALTVSAQRRQDAMDLFMAGENMKDMAGHASSAARKNIQKREIASKLPKQLPKQTPEAERTVANKISFK